jgi:ubiquinone/menaquinone biosynthesis C-methylase UbiE
VDPFDPRVVRAAYDEVADDYARTFGDDLARLPLDRAVLDDVAGELGPGALVLDLGCGPGPVSAHLAGLELRIVGVDLSPAMLARARRETGEPALACADLRHLPFPPAAFEGVVAYYSLQHVPRARLGSALTEARRVLRPGGLLVLAMHLGDGDVVMEEFLGHAVAPVGGALYAEDALRAALERAAFEIVTSRRRHGLAHEAATERVYLTGRARHRR